MRSKICASHDIIWACNDLVPQTWVIKPTKLCFVSRLSQSSTPATTPRIKPSEKRCALKRQKTSMKIEKQRLLGGQITPLSLSGLFIIFAFLMHILRERSVVKDNQSCYSLHVLCSFIKPKSNLYFGHFFLVYMRGVVSDGLRVHKSVL